MMSFSWGNYLIQMLSGIHWTLIGFIVLGILAIFTSAVDYTEEIEKRKKVFKKACVLLVISIILKILIPDADCFV
jgi:accessory gene regulator protein AgrB